MSNGYYNLFPDISSKAFEENEDYTKQINMYYQFVNNGMHEKITELYGKGLTDSVKDFFNNQDNKKNNEGIFNVKNVKILSLINISEDALDYEDGIDTYSNTKMYFVKCYMDVISPDKYYTQGVNYFVFNIGVNTSGEIKIANLEIPSYQLIDKFDDNESDVKLYKETREKYIYGSSSRLTDVSSYIDVVKNPSTIRVLYNNTVKVVSFKDYCFRVAAKEMNTINNVNGARACAMAIKMFAIHFVNTAASGCNYDIDDKQQVYAEDGTVISSSAKSAVEYVMNYFLLDRYGANFKTFYRSKASISSYCRKNGGILPQIEANAMGTNGSSWQDILKYYYTRVSGTSYYNSYMNYGNLIITTQHTHNWSNGVNCSSCGALVK